MMGEAFYGRHTTQNHLFIHNKKKDGIFHFSYQIHNKHKHSIYLVLSLGATHPMVVNWMFDCLPDLSSFFFLLPKTNLDLGGLTV